jgi:hypothetical protein
MKKHWKLISVAALGVIGLGVAGALIGGGESRSAPPPTVDLVAPPPDSVMASIDKALGRSSSTEPQNSAPNSARNGGAASIAPAPPVAVDGSGKSAQSTSGSSGSAPPAPSTNASSIDDRKIVQTATLTMQVKDVAGVSDQIGLIAGSAGGYVAASKFSSSGDQQFATVTIKVPADRYQDALSQVRKLGAKIDTDASNASDITEEYTDLGSQLRNLQATEAQLLTFLGQARNITEVLQVQDRLNAIRNDIERIKGRMNLLDKLSDMGTISVSLRPLASAAKADNGNGGFSEEVSAAWQHSLDFLAGIATAVATVLVFSWWLILLGLPAAVTAQRWLRHRPVTAGRVAYD